MFDQVSSPGGMELTLLAVSPFATIRSAPTAGSGHVIVISKAKGYGKWLSGRTDGVNLVMLEQ